MQLSLFETGQNKQLLTDLFRAYYDARKNKRNTLNALHFEIGYEQELFKLYEELVRGTYQIKPSICFINFSPVQREIFAADFRDRIVHHLVYNYIAKRTKGNAYKAMQQWNQTMESKGGISEAEKNEFLSSINSYLGVMKHYQTWKLRKKLVHEQLDKRYDRYFTIMPEKCIKYHALARS